MSKLSEKLKAIAAAIGALEKQFGKGAVMRLGAGEMAQPVAIIPSGSIGIDLPTTPRRIESDQLLSVPSSCRTESLTTRVLMPLASSPASVWFWAPVP